MALSGSFNNYPVSQFGLYCEWNGIQSISGNYTDITVKVYLNIYDLYMSPRIGNKITINGVQQTFDTPAISDSTQSWHKILLTTKTQRVKHNADGSKNGVSISVSWAYNGTYSNTSITTITATTVVNLNKIPTYTLSISSAGGSVSVNRTASGYGSTGIITNGARLYMNDRLRITFTPNAGSSIKTRTVNGSPFTSGNTYVVGGNVNIVFNSEAITSSAGATSANIGSVSTITITKHNPEYYHSLRYTFFDKSGYIKANGETSSTEERFTQTSVAFSIPTSFYSQIPNSKVGICTIECRTYGRIGDIVTLGAPTTHSFAITTSEADCAPIVDGSVIDTNPISSALTGDNKTLIRYRSNAECTILGGARNSATVKSSRINGLNTTNNKRVFHNVSTSSFNFEIADSRGYHTTRNVTPNIIPYINLTCNPILTRPNPTGSSIVMTVSGDLYRGSFGAHPNTLKLKYRYKEDGSTYGEWMLISSGITYGTNSYMSSSKISLGDNFDYQKEYVFQIQATDGSEDYTLSTVSNTITVHQGLPIFDWGKDDFNVNVPILQGGYGVMGYRRTLLSTDNLNYISNQGIYVMPISSPGSSMNYPPGAGAGVLEVINSGDGIIQRYTDFVHSVTYTRSRDGYGFVWTDWKSAIGDIETIISETVVSVENIYDLPTVGKADAVYMITSENATYRWDDTNLKYYCVGRDYNNIEVIKGGKA